MSISRCLLKKRLCFFVVVFVILVGTISGPVLGSIVGFTAATNDRFTNSSSYILNSFNVSGIGKEPDVTGEPGESSRWATAISRNVVISAFHGRPSGAVHFFEDNDASTTPVIRTIAEGERIGSTDLWIGRLNAPLPDSISHFDFADEFLSGPTDGSTVSAGTFNGENAYLFAQIRRADDPERDQRTGRNRVSGYVENIDFLGLSDNDAILFEFDSGEPDAVTYETRFISEDSGGPTFLDIVGNLTLLGINAFNYTTVDGGGGSGVTYVGNQADAIRAYIASNVVGVPEPSSFVMFGVGVLCLARRKKR